jgi:hypothetical protein
MLAGVVVAIVLGAPGAAVSAASVAGTYRVAASVEVSVPGLPGHHDLRADAVVSPGPGPRDLVVLLSTQGYRCRLVGRLGVAGALELAAGQRCRIDLEEEALSGPVDCSLEWGRGLAREGRLSLELGVQLRGLVSLGPRQPSLQFLATELPVRGRAEVRAAGRRDESRHR